MYCYVILQGGAIIRSARRTAERVGYDPDTGLHLPEAPQEQKKEPVILEDCKWKKNLISQAYNGLIQNLRWTSLFLDIEQVKS